MRILIVNVHSALNLGDDAIMQATLHALRAAYPEASVTVAANDPLSWEKDHDLTVIGSLLCWVAFIQGGRWHGRHFLVPLYGALLALAAICFRFLRYELYFGGSDQRRLLSAYYAADLVLSCGGGNFFSHRRLKPSLIVNLMALAFPLALGKRIIMLPQSVGPMEGSLNRLLSRLVFSHVDLMIVREEHSAQFVSNDLGLRERPLVLPDLAFAFLEACEASRSTRGPGDERLRIGVTVIDRASQLSTFNSQEAYENTLASLLIWLATEYGAQIEVFCQCYGPSWDQDDWPVTQRFYEHLRKRSADVHLCTRFHDFLELLDSYRKMDLIIGSRMHTAVFALSSGTPVLLIGYQPKAAGTMALFGFQRYCCDIDALDTDRLHELVRELMVNGDAIRAEISRRRIQIREQSLTWVRHLEDRRCGPSE